MDSKVRLENLYRQLLSEISGEKLVAHVVSRKNGRVCWLTRPLDPYRRIFVCGAGKASVSMAQGVLNALGTCDGGLVITKKGDSQRLVGIEVIEAAHPIPDESSLIAGERMLEFASQATEGDVVIFCLSGGASALMESLNEGISLETLREKTNEMLRSGLPIERINENRSMLSRIKGGKLSLAFQPARVLVIILSDVSGDRIEVIGSQPFIPDSKDQVLVGGYETSRGVAGVLAPEARIARRFYEGEARDLAPFFAAQMRNPGYYVWAGEPTVTVNGTGTGGRCQELALAMAITLRERPGTAFLAGSTDGTDGPTDVAGAVVDSFSANDQAERYLADNDSGGYFARYGGGIITGPTGSNLNDIFIGWVG
ncbi:glycerate kinase [soil metagenome]